MDRSRGNPNYSRGGRGGPRGHHQEVTIPADLDEVIEFFEITKSDADYSFITDLKEPFHANWMHVLLCSILISSTGVSYTLDNLHNAVQERGAKEITKEDLATFLQCDYYHKHETYLEPKIETCRFSINTGVIDPSTFLFDLSQGKHSAPPKSIGLNSDGAMFILSMVRNAPSMAGTRGGDGERGELLFKEADNRNNKYLGMVDKPGQLYRNVNSRTTMITYTKDEDGKLNKVVKPCIAIQKRQQAKEFYYCFYPQDGPGGW